MRFAGIKDKIKPSRGPTKFEQVLTVIKDGNMSEERRSDAIMIYLIRLVILCVTAMLLSIPTYYGIKQMVGTTDSDVDIACAEAGGKWVSMPGADDAFGCDAS